VNAIEPNTILRKGKYLGPWHLTELQLTCRRYPRQTTEVTCANFDGIELLHLSPFEQKSPAMLDNPAQQGVLTLSPSPALIEQAGRRLKLLFNLQFRTG